MFKTLRTFHSLLCWMTAFFLMMVLGFLVIGGLSRFSRNPKKNYHWATRICAKFILWLGRIKVKTEGLHNVPGNPNYIFAPNHESILDILILGAVVPQYFLFVMDEELFKIPLLGKYSRQANYLPISRTRPKRAYQNLRDIITQLKQGESIVIFPEGRVSVKGELEEFKTGIGIIVVESGVPVIPVAISGSARLMPHGSLISRPGLVRVKFGKPLYFEPDRSYPEIAQKIRNDLAEMLRELRLN